MPIDPDVLISNLYPDLHASGESDVVFTDRDELLRFLGDAAKSLAQRFGVFVVRHENRILIQGQLMYDAPPRHVSTLHVAILETGKPLIASSTKEMEQRSTSYRTSQATTAKPIRWFFEDKSGVNQIGIVRVPSAAEAGQHLEVIYHSFPCEIEEGIEAIQTWGDYLEACSLSAAYEPDSDFSIPEASQAYRGLASLYESIAGKYYSFAQ